MNCVRRAIRLFWNSRSALILTNLMRLLKTSPRGRSSTRGARDADKRNGRQAPRIRRQHAAEYSVRADRPTRALAPDRDAPYSIAAATLHTRGPEGGGPPVFSGLAMTSEA